MLALAKRPEAGWSLTHVQIGGTQHPMLAMGWTSNSQTRHITSLTTMASYVTVIRRRVITAPSESATGSCLPACHSACGLNADRRDKTLK
jgi:hypothetical protein